jgi:hypothetical protein
MALHFSLQKIIPHTYNDSKNLQGQKSGFSAFLNTALLNMGQLATTGELPRPAGTKLPSPEN